MSYAAGPGPVLLHGPNAAIAPQGGRAKLPGYVLSLVPVASPWKASPARVHLLPQAKEKRDQEERLQKAREEVRAHHLCIGL